MTAEERKAKFMRISELSGDNEEIMNALAELQQDELEDSSPTYSESDVMDKDGVRWDKKYSDLQERYRERFFTPSEPEVEPVPVNEAETITFDDLFK